MVNTTSKTLSRKAGREAKAAEPKPAAPAEKAPALTLTGLREMRLAELQKLAKDVNLTIGMLPAALLRKALEHKLELSG